MAKTGTEEWAEINKNLYLGCENDCKYCYARSNALRFKRIKDKNHWQFMQLSMKAFQEKPKLYKGKRIMFPTTHDIFPTKILQTVDYLKRWLEVGNEILIVSKPHPECITKLCNELQQYKDQDCLPLHHWKHG